MGKKVVAGRKVTVCAKSLGPKIAWLFAKTESRCSGWGLRIDKRSNMGEGGKGIKEYLGTR